MCLDILRVTPNLETLNLRYGLESGGSMDQIADLLRCGLYTRLTTLRLESSSLCACKMRHFFSIRGLQSLFLGRYSRYYVDCFNYHSALRNPDPRTIGASTVTDLSIASWESSPSLSHILSLPKHLLKFEGRWTPSGRRCSPLKISRFLFPHKDTLETLDLSAMIDTYDEYDPQETDGTFADFTEFTALRELKCDPAIVLPDSFRGPVSESFADRLPTQLETLALRNIPRIISEHAHRPNTRASMAAFATKLGFLRSISRAAHQRHHLASLRSITLHESSYLPGPIEGNYLRPKQGYALARQRED